MEYIIGIGLGFGVLAFTMTVGLDRDRAFYPTVLIVVASYYVLFAVSSAPALVWEIFILGLFVSVSIIGFKGNLWVVVLALAAHGLFDSAHDSFISNAGVPAWWPKFCMSFDVSAALFLAWRLMPRSTFGQRIQPHVEAELLASQRCEAAGDFERAFAHLEAAHVLSQRATWQHVRVHLRMLSYGLRRRDCREVRGQITRTIGAAVTTSLGLIPVGNTGGANVSPTVSLPIRDDLAQVIAHALSEPEEAPTGTSPMSFRMIPKRALS